MLAAFDGAIMAVMLMKKQMGEFFAAPSRLWNDQLRILKSGANILIRTTVPQRIGDGDDF